MDGWINDPHINLCDNVFPFIYPSIDSSILLYIYFHLSTYSSFYSSSHLSVYLFNHPDNLLLVPRRVRMSVSRRSSTSLSRGRAPSVKPEDESKSYSYANLCRDHFRNPNNSTQFSRKDLSQPLLKHTADSDKEVR